MWTKDTIVELLNKNDRAVERAILCLFDRQTSDEKVDSITKHYNNRGFCPCHAVRGTKMARWILSGRHLTGWHLAKAREITLRYTRQLVEQAQINQAHKAGTITAQKQFQNTLFEEQSMQQIEAQGDRAQTVREEVEKHTVRQQMEMAHA